MAREAAEGGRVSLWVRELVAGVKSPPGGDSRPLRRHDGEREGGGGASRDATLWKGRSDHSPAVARVGGVGRLANTRHGRDGGR
jgi:hypothetical protein